MECQERAFQLMEYAEGNLRGEELHLIEGHLASCARCRRELDSWRQLEAALRSFPVVAEPAGFTASVMRRLEVSHPRTLPRDWGWAEIWLPVAASALMIPVLAVLLFVAGNLDALTVSYWQEEVLAGLQAYLWTALPYLAASFWVLGSGLMIAFLLLGMERRKQRLTQ